LQRQGDFEVVAANDLGDAKTMAHLLKHDSVLGRLDEDVEVGRGGSRSAARTYSCSPNATPRIFLGAILASTS